MIKLTLFENFMITYLISEHFYMLSYLPIQVNYLKIFVFEGYPNFEQKLNFCYKMCRWLWPSETSLSNKISLIVFQGVKGYHVYFLI